MELLGIVRYLDKLGRFVIPYDWRKYFNFNYGDSLVIEKYELKNFPDCYLIKKLDTTDIKESHKIDTYGRIMLPKAARNYLKLTVNDGIEIFGIRKLGIIIKKEEKTL